ncbi:MAG: BlaI/MecI/CopY family transcriptional regulator [Acidobacteriia bacterium]|nr:BlaI/MecI/CopY family transcriptional regulator [Terriglobia bacterium]
MRRKPASRGLPPPLELICLQALWRLGEGTVHDVRKAVSKERVLAYTTVMTLLDRLEKRDCVGRRKPGRSYVYRPKVSRDTLRQHALKQLLDGFFDGSADALLNFLRQPREPHAGPR